MSKIIKLTGARTGTPIWIMVDHIQAIENMETNGNANIWLDSGSEAVEVKETPEAVISLILQTFSPGAV